MIYAELNQRNYGKNLETFHNFRIINLDKEVKLLNNNYFCIWRIGVEKLSNNISLNEK